MGMQNRLAEVFYEKVQPRLEVLLDELFGENYQVSVDRIEIDCGLLDEKDWEQQFTEQAIRKLREQLLQVDKRKIDSKKRDEMAAAETFFFFLENGFLPWNSRIDSIAMLEQQLSIDKKLLDQLKKLVRENRVVAERLASQFSEKFTGGIVTGIAEDKSLLQLFTLVKEPENKRLLTVELLKAFAGDDKGWVQEVVSLLKSKKEADMEPAFKDLITGITKKMGTPELDKRIEQEKPAEAIYINNAGLVLLHPFLPSLFQHLKLLDENKWIDEASKNKAALILAFLATRNDEVEEFDLVLNKVLCGIEIKELVVTGELLNEEIKNECEALLANVVEHWDALKNTSTDGLREAFIYRRGKLSRVENGWLLQVAQKPVDVLLGRLPWGIGVVKLPWMEAAILTEWA